VAAESVLDEASAGCFSPECVQVGVGDEPVIPKPGVLQLVERFHISVERALFEFS